MSLEPAAAHGSRPPATCPCVLRYELTLATSDFRGAGTDGVVWVQLEGTLGASGWTRLEASADNVRPFSAAGVAVVLLWSPLACPLLVLFTS